MPMAFQNLRLWLLCYFLESDQCLCTSPKPIWPYEETRKSPPHTRW